MEWSHRGADTTVRSEDYLRSNGDFELAINDSDDAKIAVERQANGGAIQEPVAILFDLSKAHCAVTTTGYRDRVPEFWRDNMDNNESLRKVMHDRQLSGKQVADLLGMTVEGVYNWTRTPDTLDTEDARHRLQTAGTPARAGRHPQ